MLFNFIIFYSGVKLIHEDIEVGTHEGTRPYSLLKSLHEGTGRRDLSHEQFTRSVFGNTEVAVTCPKNSNWFEFVGLVARTKQSWSLRLEFEEKMASSHNGTCPWDLLQGLVAGTSPLVCADLKPLQISSAYCGKGDFV